MPSPLWYLLGVRAISSWQPWPWAILDLPRELAKDVENRQRAVRTVEGEVLALHAPVKVDGEWAWRVIRAASGRQPPPVEALPRGAIVGLVEVVRAVRESDSRWFWGPEAWELGRRVAFDEPIPCKGSNRTVWDLPLDVEAEVRAAAARAGFSLGQR